jgi:hypothetical protein
LGIHHGLYEQRHKEDEKRRVHRSLPPTWGHGFLLAWQIEAPGFRVEAGTSRSDFSTAAMLAYSVLSASVHDLSAGRLISSSVA